MPASVRAAARLLPLLFLAFGVAHADAALVTSNLNYNVTSLNDNVTRGTTAVVTRRDDLGVDLRPVVMVMPGWGGVGDPQAAQEGNAVLYANAGYIAVNIGFHQTGSTPGSPLVSWYSDLAESAKGALDAVCAQAYANCAGIIISGGSYGGTQTHPVVRFLRAYGYDGAVASRKVVGILSQDAGYTLHWGSPADADATAYSIAMIENQGDEYFPIDACNDGNCGVRNRADHHQGAAGSQYVLSQCPAGGLHGSRGYADWNAWVLSAVKTMLHSHRGLPTFSGYVGPSIAVSNACVTAPAAGGLLNTSLNYNVTSDNDGVVRANAVQVTRRNDFGAGRRPVIMVMPGWGGSGDVAAAQEGNAINFANAGYVAINIGFHQTSDRPGAGLVNWYSDLAESAKGALDAVCAQAYSDCSGVVITGGSYGGTQTHPVVRYLRALGTYDGTAGRKVVGILAQDAGYTLHWQAPVDADATAYSIALIETLGDSTFPVDSCDFGNCGARNRADHHKNAAGSQYVLSQCPAGGGHGTRGYASWDAWVLSAIKTMLHVHRFVPTFTGYTGPSVTVSNACVTSVAAGPDLSISQSATPNPASSGKDVVYTLTASNAGPDSATGVTVMDMIPAGTSFVWASPGCSHASGTVTCTIGTLASGAGASRKVVVRPAAPGNITNNASVGAAQADPNNANNASAATMAVNASPAGAQTQRYRLYSDVTKEHHFTTDLNEYNVLGSYAGTWTQEGTVGKVLNNPGTFNGVAAVPYYRLYDPGTRWHHWTIDANEYYTLGTYGWNLEGVDGYILPSAAAGTMQLYRLNYPALGSLHHWTIDANEYSTLVAQHGWVGEGGSGFVIQ